MSLSFIGKLSSVLLGLWFIYHNLFVAVAFALGMFTQNLLNHGCTTWNSLSKFVATFLFDSCTYVRSGWNSVQNKYGMDPQSKLYVKPPVADILTEAQSEFAFQEVIRIFNALQLLLNSSMLRSVIKSNISTLFAPMSQHIHLPPPASSTLSSNGSSNAGSSNAGSSNGLSNDASSNVSSDPGSFGTSPAPNSNPINPMDIFSLLGSDNLIGSLLGDTSLKPNQKPEHKSSTNNNRHEKRSKKSMNRPSDHLTE